MAELPNICRVTREVRQWASPVRLAEERIKSSKIGGDARVCR